MAGEENRVAPTEPPPIPQEDVSPLKKKPPTASQMERLAHLREAARKMGGAAAVLAEQRCTATEEAVEEYLRLLMEMLVNVSMASGTTPASVPTPSSPPPPAPSGHAHFRISIPKTYRGRKGRYGATPRQKARMIHFQQGLGSYPDDWAQQLAVYPIPYLLGDASDFIQEVSRRLRARYSTAPTGQICSVCLTPGCVTGPMIPWDGVERGR